MLTKIDEIEVSVFYECYFETVNNPPPLGIYCYIYVYCTGEVFKPLIRITDQAEIDRIITAGDRIGRQEFLHINYFQKFINKLKNPTL